jgi:hypothetical protein
MTEHQYNSASKDVVKTCQSILDSKSSIRVVHSSNDSNDDLMFPGEDGNFVTTSNELAGFE